MRGLAARIVLLEGWRRALLALGAGSVLALGLAPFNLFGAGFLAFPVLVWLLDGAAGKPGGSLSRRLLPAFRIGWLFGFGYFVAGLWWLGAAMLNDGDAFLWAIPLAVLVLPAILAFYFGLAAALARAFWSDGGGRILALAGSLSLFEVLRGWLLTGFSWNEIGIIAAPVPILMQSVSIVGLHGLTLAAVYIFAAPALLADHGRRRAALSLALALVGLHVGFGGYRLATAASGTVEGIGLRLVQPNILQTQKWDAAEADRIFDRLITLTEARARPEEANEAPAARTLVIWPESSFPFLLTERPDAIARLADTLQPDETLIAGAVRAEPTADGAPRYYNSVYVIDDTGQIVDARDKVHLVPFGEYLPFQTVLESYGLSQLARLPGGFSAGTERTPMAPPGAPAMLPLICYEIVFQDEIDVPGRDGILPGFIVNVTNDAWFGNTSGPYQHLRHAEVAAVALGLPLVRSANTGISLVNDAYGVLREGLSLGSTGTIETGLPVALSPTVFSRLGNIVFWCVFAMTWIGACVSMIKDARQD